MPSFGENLRREREMRGISLEEISAATKISVRFLGALENDDFAAIPGGIFTRGFIRAYAGYLGLDQEQVMAEYELVAQPEDFELGRLSSANRPSRRRARPVRVLPLVVAAGLLVGGYALFRYSHRVAYLPLVTSPPAPSSAAQPTTSPGGSTSSPAPASPGASTTTAANPSSAAPDGATSTASAPPMTVGASSQATPPQAGAVKPEANPPVSGPTGNAATPRDGLVLQLAATEPVWVSVEADGKTALQRVLRPNDVTTLKAEDHFDLTTGNAQGLILTLNGETLKPLGRQGEVKKVHLTRVDVKSPSP